MPYYIVKGKARLGTVVHKKTATALALTGIKNEDKMEFSQLVEAIKGSYNDKFEAQQDLGWRHHGRQVPGEVCCQAEDHRQGGGSACCDLNPSPNRGCPGADGVRRRGLWCTLSSCGDVWMGFRYNRVKRSRP